MSRDKKLPPEPPPPTSFGNVRRPSRFGGNMYRFTLLCLLTYFCVLIITSFFLLLVEYTTVNSTPSTNTTNSSQEGVYHHNYHHHQQPRTPDAAGEIIFHDDPNMEPSQRTGPRITSTAGKGLHLYYILVPVAEAPMANFSDFNMKFSVSNGVLRSSEAFPPSSGFASTLTSTFTFTSTVTSTLASTVTSNILSTVYSTVASTVVPTASPYPWPGTNDGVRAVMKEVEEASDFGPKRTNEGTMGMKRVVQFEAKPRYLFGANGRSKESRAEKLERLGLMWQERLSKSKKGAQRIRQMSRELKKEVRVACSSTAAQRRITTEGGAVP